MLKPQKPACSSNSLSSTARKHSPSMRTKVISDAKINQSNNINSYRMKTNTIKNKNLEKRDQDCRRNSLKILFRQLKEREKIKVKMLKDQQIERRQIRCQQVNQTKQWRQKMKKSPFLVDLVAENERLGEENRLCDHIFGRKEKTYQMRKVNLKNSIIKQALFETNDTNALRKEKRNILLEEKRLKALLDLEKVKSKRKQDLLAAQRVESQRKVARVRYRREQHMKRILIEDIDDRKLLIEKLDISKSNNTQNSYGIKVGRGIIAPLGGACG